MDPRETGPEASPAHDGEEHDHACGDPGCAEGHVAALPFRRDSPKLGRNDPCPCGSGKKYKKCCLGRE